MPPVIGGMFPKNGEVLSSSTPRSRVRSPMARYKGIEREKGEMPVRIISPCSYRHALPGTTRQAAGYSDAFGFVRSYRVTPSTSTLSKLSSTHDAMLSSLFAPGDPITPPPWLPEMK